MYLVFSGRDKYGEGCFIACHNGHQVNKKVVCDYIFMQKNYKSSFQNGEFDISKDLIYISQDQSEAMDFAMSYTGYNRPKLYNIDTMPNGRVAIVISYAGRSDILNTLIGTLVYKINDQVFSVTDKHVDFGGNSEDQFINETYEFELIPVDKDE